jgi:hypothetical protein
MKYLNSINVQPSEFPNFKDKDIPGVKSQAMAILKEMGKGAAPVILNNLVQELEKMPKDNMGMTSNEDYVFNLKMLLEDIGRDAINDLKAAIARSNGATKSELQRILDRILKKEKDLQKDLDLKSDVRAERGDPGQCPEGTPTLLSEQGANGSWVQHPGYTALSLLTLLKAGLDPSRDECQKAASFIATAELSRTYDVALTALALDEMDRRRYRPVIETCVRFLQEKQLNNGMWDYRKPPSNAPQAININQGQGAVDGDHSNSQFALLGLIAAQKSGISIPTSVLDRARRHWSESQNAADGGWGYGSSRGQSQSYGSMTAAGVASLFLLGNDLYSQTEKCGIYVENDRVARGLDWIARNWSVSMNPGAKGGPGGALLLSLCGRADRRPHRAEVHRQPRLVPRRGRVPRQGPEARRLVGPASLRPERHLLRGPVSREGSRADPSQQDALGGEGADPSAGRAPLGPRRPSRSSGSV